MVRVPFKFRDATLDDFSDDVVQPARELLARLEAVEPTEGHKYDFRGVEGLVVVGPLGVGKSHYAAAIAHCIPTQFGTFVSALEVVDEARAAIRSDQEPTDYGRYRRVLILDDLSAIRPTDFALDTLARIIRLRYDECLPTVVTTHTGHDDLGEMYGRAIASRLLEFGPIVKLTGSDRRRQRAPREGAGGLRI